MKLLVALLPMTLLPATRAQDAPAKDIVDTAVATGRFGTLTKALAAAGLVDTLRGKGPFTIFAPTDEAFASLPAGTLDKLLAPGARDSLVRILTHHVVAGRIGAVEALEAGKATTLAELELGFRLQGGKLQVGPATVIENDVAASNGVIHVIDSVLVPPAADRDEGPIALIELAIERGVPIFNRGDQDACAAIYEITARALLARDAQAVPPAACKSLQTALREAEQAATPFDRAWDLRRGLDRALRDIRRAAAGTAAGDPTAGDARTVFGFDDARRDPRWVTVNDDVMGGVSQSSYEPTANGTAFFRGALSRQNNGGFATIRSPAADLDLGSYDGVVLRVQGDGRRYAFLALRGDSRMDVRVWKKEFETQAGQWQEIRMPFAELTLSVMGRTVPGAPRIAGDQIRSLSFLIADGKEAPFALEIDWIRAYRESTSVSAGGR